MRNLINEGIQGALLLAVALVTVVAVCTIANQRDRGADVVLTSVK